MLPEKKFYRYLDLLTLVIIVVMLFLKLFVVKCSLLFCGIFVLVVVSWSVLSGHRTRMEDK